MNYKAICNLAMSQYNGYVLFVLFCFCILIFHFWFSLSLYTLFCLFFYYSDDAILFGGVRCTFWALGESLKPGGFVMNFVIVAFCYHLYSQPSGHPNVSKCHYFFSSISVSVFLSFFFLFIFIYV